MELTERKPGAVTKGPPKVVWVRMLKRPTDVGVEQGTKVIFSLQGKFNSIMEERLADGCNDHHRILSIEVDCREFTVDGDLTPAGVKSFWKEVDRGLMKFDLDQITLKPHNYQPSSKQPIAKMTANL